MERRTRAARALLACVLSVAPLLVGSVHPVVVGVEAAVLAVAAALALSSHDASAQIRLRGVFLVLVLAVGWTGLQLVPLPARLLQVLSPRAYAIHLGGPLIGGGDWAPITLDPAATLGALAGELGLLAAFVCVRGAWTHSELRSSRGPLRYVAIGALIAGLAALCHAVVSAETVFGVYRPITQPGAGLLSLPLVNPNNLSGLMNIGALASLGVALGEHRREARWAWAGSAVFCAVVTLLTLSRGGIATLVVGAAFLLVVVRPGRAGVGRAAAALGALVCGAAAYVAAGRLLAEVSTLLDLGKLSQIDRLPLARGAFRMALAHPVAGVGRGSFFLAFPPFSLQSHRVTYTHPEVLPLQLACEWGLPFAALFLAVCIAAWIAAVRRRPGAAQSAALAAVLAVFAQNFADFSLEIFAVALPAAACFAMSIRWQPDGRRRDPVRPTGDAQHGATRGSRRWFRPSTLAACWVPIGLAAALAGDQAGTLGAQAEGSRLRELVDKRVDPGKLADLGRRMMRRHPADAYLPTQVARGLVGARPDAALPFLNRALWLDPRSPAAQLLTGRALLRLGLEGQAVLHYRAAAQWEPRDAVTVAREVATFVRDPDAALRFVPRGPGGLAALATLVKVYSERSEQRSALLLARELARRSKQSPEAMAVMARVLLESGRPQEAVAAARTTRGTDWHCEGASTESRALVQIDRRPEAIRVLELAARSCPDDFGLWGRLVIVATESRNWETAERALAAYRGAASAAATDLAYGYFLEGTIERARDRHGPAAAAFQHAADLQPDSRTYAQNAVQSWERIGRHDRAEPLRRALGLPRAPRSE